MQHPQAAEGERFSVPSSIPVLCASMPPPLANKYRPARARNKSTVRVARMDQRWMATLSTEKTLFQAARFMDDILLVYAAHPGWDHSELVRKLTASECYSAPRPGAEPSCSQGAEPRGDASLLRLGGGGARGARRRCGHVYTVLSP